ncbi:endo-beta-N-acetylglucosaminidase [Umezawaea tangerina]|nr:glycoside hydrolase [Umezawaea tangerina]
MSTRRQFMKLGLAAAATPLLPTGFPRAEAEVDAAAGIQPFASYWHPNTLLAWDPATDPDARFNRASVPLAPRAVPARPANAHAHPGEAKVQPLVAYAPTSGNPAQGALEINYYATNYWQYMDTLVFWGGSASEGLILAPNPTVTDAAHRNGVKVVGNVFLPPTAYGGRIQWVRDFVQRDGDRFPVADKMVEVARHHGFDGWFVNQETAGGDAALAAAMRDMVAQLRASGLHVIWYDAMTRTGGVSWQNALTASNQMFLQDGATRVSDQMFLNFWWSGSGLAGSAALARSLGRSPYELFSGVDVESNGYNTAVGWSSVFPEDQPHVTSLGFYRPEWTFKSSTGPADFYARDNRFWVGPNGDPANTTSTASWKGVAHYVTELTPITSLPFVTNFDTGHGRLFAVDGQVVSTSPWHNLSLQDVLPTWRWSVGSTGTKVVPGLDWDRAWDGGTSLKVTGTPSADNDIRLFATELALGGAASLELVYDSGAAGPSRLLVGLQFADAPDTTELLDVGDSAGGWQRAVFALDAHADRVLVGISLRVTAGGAFTGYVGRLGVHETATPAEIAAPGPVTVEQVARSSTTTAAVRLGWVRSPDAVRQYRVFKRDADGTRTFLGGTPNDAYFVPAVAKAEGEEVTLEVVAVSEAFAVSTASEVVVS